MVASAARAGGKRLTVHIAADTPSWLAGLGAQIYSFNSPFTGSGTAAVPWDTVFLGRYGDFMAALAGRIRARGDTDILSVVSVGAPVGEMSLPACLNGALGTITYDRALYLGAWRNSIAAVNTAFANSSFSQLSLVISAPVSEICRPGADGAAFYAEVMSNALSLTPRAGVFMADLNALGSSRLVQVNADTRSRSRLHFQTIWSFSQDPTNRFQGPLGDAICHSWRAGVRYVELYKADLLSTNTAVRNAIAVARTGVGC